MFDLSLTSATPLTGPLLIPMRTLKFAVVLLTLC